MINAQSIHIDLINSAASISYCASDIDESLDVVGNEDVFVARNQNNDVVTITLTELTPRSLAQAFSYATDHGLSVPQSLQEVLSNSMEHIAPYELAFA
jgi:hypothetical protein